LSTLINIHKGGVLVLCALLMVFYQNFSMDAMVYTALHGSYGLLWLLKHYAFPDPAWNVEVSTAGAILGSSMLACYWTFPYVLISSRNQSPASPLLVALCILLHTCGVGIMLLADAQKFFVLKERGRGLIRTGMFRYVRHPNYTGEMMLYLAYALLIRHWWPALVLLVVWVGLFAVRIIAKESSMARYPDWAAYRASSWYIIPKVL
jgi:protein-S-isoprenylcysteine O-methyltransferase Ste14